MKEEISIQKDLPLLLVDLDIHPMNNISFSFYKKTKNILLNINKYTHLTFERETISFMEFKKNYAGRNVNKPIHVSFLLYTEIVYILFNSN